MSPSDASDTVCGCLSSSPESMPELSDEEVDVDSLSEELDDIL